MPKWHNGLLHRKRFYQQNLQRVLEWQDSQRDSSSTRDTSPSTPKLGIQQLPPELILAIASYLHIRDLASFTASSKHLSSILTPELYSHTVRNYLSGVDPETLGSNIQYVKKVDTHSESTPGTLESFPALTHLYITGLEGVKPRPPRYRDDPAAFEEFMKELDRERDRIEQPEQTRVLEKSAVTKARDWVTKYPQNFAQLTEVHIVACGAASLRVILAACTNLTALYLNKRQKGTTSSTREILDAVMDEAGKTLVRLTTNHIAEYAKESEMDTLTATVGDAQRCPALRSVRFDSEFRGQVSLESPTPGRRANFVLDLYRANTRNPAWRWDQDVGDCRWDIFIDDIMHLTAEQFTALWPWMKRHVKAESRFVTVSEADELCPEAVEHMNGLNTPFHLLYHAVELPYIELAGFANLEGLCLKMRDVLHDFHELGSTGEDYEEATEMAADEVVDMTFEWERWIYESLSQCRQLVSFSISHGHAEHWHWYFLGEVLRPVLSDLCTNHSLRELDIDVSAMLKGGRGSLERFIPTGVDTDTVASLCEHTEGVDEFRWLAEPGLFPNLTRLTLRDVYIVNLKDREWFYSLPRALEKLQQLHVQGLCWDPLQEREDESHWEDVDSEGWRSNDDLDDTDSDSSSSEEVDKIDSLDPEDEKKPPEDIETDNDIDLRFGELVNHGLRKERVKERILRKLRDTITTTTAGKEPRDVEFLIEDLWLFVEDLEDERQGMPHGEDMREEADSEFYEDVEETIVTPCSPEDVSELGKIK